MKPQKQRTVFSDMLFCVEAAAETHSASLSHCSRVRSDRVCHSESGLSDPHRFPAEFAEPRSLSPVIVRFQQEVFASAEKVDLHLLFRSVSRIINS